MSVVESADSKIASLASQGLFDPAALTLDEMRAICAAALTRVPDHRQQEIFHARPLYEQIDMVLAEIRVAEQPDEEVARRRRQRNKTPGRLLPRSCCVASSDPMAKRDNAIELCPSVSLRPLEPSEPSQSKSRWREPSKSLRRLRIRASWWASSGNEAEVSR